MTRRRDGLLPRMEARPWADGSRTTYRYHPLGGKPVTLGTDYDAAIKRVLALTSQPANHGTVAWVWEHWCANSRRWARLAEPTKVDYQNAFKSIDKHLGGVRIADLKAPRVARYVHLDRASSPRRAGIEKALLSNLFKHGIMLGVCEINATLGVESPATEVSTVMPATQVLETFHRWLASGTPQRRVLARAVEFAAISGARQVEFLPLTWTRVDEAAGVIRLNRGKQRGKKVVVDVVAITPRMRALLAECDRERPYLFPTEDGNAYDSQGFKTLWQRAVHAGIDAGVLTAADRFNFHSLRRYFTTTHRSQYGSRPNLHADERVTARVYDATVEEHRRAL
jgi:integrase